MTLNDLFTDASSGRRVDFMSLGTVLKSPSFFIASLISKVRWLSTYVQLWWRTSCSSRSVWNHAPAFPLPDVPLSKVPRTPFRILNLWGWLLSGCASKSWARCRYWHRAAVIICKLNNSLFEFCCVVFLPIAHCFLSAETVKCSSYDRTPHPPILLSANLGQSRPISATVGKITKCRQS